MSTLRWGSEVMVRVVVVKVKMTTEMMKRMVKIVMEDSNGANEDSEWSPQ